MQIRVEFVEIRGYLLINPLQMQMHTHLLRENRRNTPRFLDIHDVDIDDDIPKALSNCFSTFAFPTELIDKYPRIFIYLIRILILKAVLVISFRDRYGCAIEVLLTSD